MKGKKEREEEQKDNDKKEVFIVSRLGEFSNVVGKRVPEEE